MSDAAAMPKRELTPKQQKFVIAYCSHLNATKAAMEAGFSENSAPEQGYQLLRKTSVAHAVRERQVKVMHKIEVKAEAVVQGIATIATFDPALIHDADGQPLPMHEWPAAARLAFAGYDSNGRPKFYDKGRAQDQLMRHLGLYSDKLDINATLTLEQIVMASLPPAAQTIEHEPLEGEEE